MRVDFPFVVEHLNDWMRFQKDVDDLLVSKGIGDVDGNEIGRGTFSIFVCGASAVAVWNAIFDRLPSAPAALNRAHVVDPIYGNFDMEPPFTRWSSSASARD